MFDPIGSEIRKTGPAVIVSQTQQTEVWRGSRCALTSNTEHQYPSGALVTINEKVGKVMADQIMASDKIRLKNQLVPYQESIYCSRGRNLGSFGNASLSLRFNVRYKTHGGMWQ